MSIVFTPARSRSTFLNILTVQIEVISMFSMLRDAEYADDGEEGALLACALEARLHNSSSWPPKALPQTRLWFQAMKQTSRSQPLAVYMSKQSWTWSRWEHNSIHELLLVSNIATGGSHHALRRWMLFRITAQVAAPLLIHFTCDSLVTVRSCCNELG